MSRSIRVGSLAPSLSMGAIGALALACSSGRDPLASLPPKSVITGTVDVASFAPSAVAIAAQDENGASSSAPLGSSGAFTLSLPSGHVYHLSVELQQGSALLIFPKTDRIDDAFALDSDGAVVPLGAIRQVSSTSLSVASSSVATETVSCTQGYQSTPASCDDVAVVLGYGTLASAIGSAPAGTLFAVSTIEPPCDIVGCDLPGPGNPEQGTVAD